jgi:hypothetical protein
MVPINMSTDKPEELELGDHRMDEAIGILTI